jgi:hypothetical protein
MDLHYVLSHSDFYVSYFSCIASICVYTVWVACFGVKILFYGGEIGFSSSGHQGNSNKSSNILLFLGL